ncbi:unnamed protein product [Amoebophrya sp. A25]|nr:unnamed protein product [Amoebophrya sp. A25]|eukprot:GSA25T00016881001.1
MGRGPGFDYVGCGYEAARGGAINSGFLLLFDYVQTQRPITAQRAGTFFAGCFLYQALQCPLEAYTRRRSCTHNFFAGGLLGGMGVYYQQIGVPFVSENLLYGRSRPFPWLRPWHAGFAVYGGIAMTFAALMGKPF